MLINIFASGMYARKCKIPPALLQDMMLIIGGRGSSSQTQANYRQESPSLVDSKSGKL